MGFSVIGPVHSYIRYELNVFDLCAFSLVKVYPAFQGQPGQAPGLFHGGKEIAEAVADKSPSSVRGIKPLGILYHMGMSSYHYIRPPVCKGLCKGSFFILYLMRALDPKVTACDHHIGIFPGFFKLFFYKLLLLCIYHLKLGIIRRFMPVCAVGIAKEGKPYTVDGKILWIL